MAFSIGRTFLNRCRGSAGNWGIHTAQMTWKHIFQKCAPHPLGDFWFALHPDDKHKIMGSPNGVRDIMKRCSPMPAANAGKILAMLESGQAHLKAGLRSVQPSRGGFDLHFDAGQARADFIVNAVTPASYGIPRRTGTSRLRRRQWSCKTAHLRRPGDRRDLR
ncbi:hypothetical protein J2Y41_003860 [Arthrobacter sp. 1088]|nr:hypothetical protein [Arthrobacter sp. 1088]